MENTGKYRKEVRVLDIPFWGKTSSMFVQVFMNREPKSDSDLFKIMMRFKKKNEQSIDEIILKFNFNELMTIYSYLNGGELPDDFIDQKTGALKLIHPDPETKKARKIIKFKLDEGKEDPNKKGTLLISVADYTNVIKGQAKKPVTIYKRLIVSEVEIFKKFIGNIVEMLMSATIQYHMFNKYFRWQIRDIIHSKPVTTSTPAPEVEEEPPEEDFEEEAELGFEEEF